VMTSYLILHLDPVTFSVKRQTQLPNGLHSQMFVDTASHSLYVPLSSDYSSLYSSNNLYVYDLEKSNFQSVTSYTLKDECVETVHDPKSQVALLFAHNGMVDVWSTGSARRRLTNFTTSQGMNGYTLGVADADFSRNKLYVVASFNQSTGYAVKLQVFDITNLAKISVYPLPIQTVVLTTSSVSIDSIYIDKIGGQAFVGLAGRSGQGSFVRVDVSRYQNLETIPVVVNANNGIVAQSFMTGIQNQSIVVYSERAINVFEYASTCPNDCSGDPYYGYCDYGTCVCSPMFTGDDCSLLACNFSCGEDQGAGVCFDGSCLCAPNWTGGNCETQTEQNMVLTFGLGSKDDFKPGDFVLIVAGVIGCPGSIIRIKSVDQVGKKRSVLMAVLFDLDPSANWNFTDAVTKLQQAVAQATANPINNPFTRAATAAGVTPIAFNGFNVDTTPVSPNTSTIPTDTQDSGLQGSASPQPEKQNIALIVGLTVGISAAVVIAAIVIAAIVLRRKRGTRDDVEKVEEMQSREQVVVQAPSNPEVVKTPEEVEAAAPVEKTQEDSVEEQPKPQENAVAKTGDEAPDADAQKNNAEDQKTADAKETESETNVEKREAGVDAKEAGSSAEDEEANTEGSGSEAGETEASSEDVEDAQEEDATTPAVESKTEEAQKIEPTPAQSAEPAPETPQPAQNTTPEPLPQPAQKDEPAQTKAPEPTPQPAQIIVPVADPTPQPPQKVEAEAVPEVPVVPTARQKKEQAMEAKIRELEEKMSERVDQMDDLLLLDPSAETEQEMQNLAQENAKTAEHLQTIKKRLAEIQQGK